MCPQGIYPAADVCALGDEISSTYEGRHVTLYGDNIEHGSQVSYVTKGYGVWFEQAVGMPFTTQTAALGNPLMTIDTEGIWCVDVTGANDGGNEAVSPGQALYINTTTGAVSKIRDNATQLPFGYALGNVTSGATERIAVKVHWDPISHTLLDKEPLYFGDANEVSLTFKPATMCGSTAEILELDCLAVPELSSAFQIKAIGVAGTQDVGIAAYFDSLAVGVMTGNWVYGFGAWLNLDETFDAPAGAYAIVAQSNGVYAGTVVDYATADVVYGLKAEGILTAQPEDLYAFSLNSSAQGSVNTAIFYSANCETVGWAAGHLSGVAAGHLALAVVNGSGVATEMFVNLWSA